MSLELSAEPISDKSFVNELVLDEDEVVEELEEVLEVEDALEELSRLVSES